MPVRSTPQATFRTACISRSQPTRAARARACVSRSTSSPMRAHERPASASRLAAGSLGVHARAVNCGSPFSEPGAAATSLADEDLPAAAGSREHVRHADLRPQLLARVARTAAEATFRDHDDRWVAAQGPRRVGKPRVRSLDAVEQPVEPRGIPPATDEVPAGTPSGYEERSRRQRFEPGAHRADARPRLPAERGQLQSGIHALRMPRSSERVHFVVHRDEQHDDAESDEPQRGGRWTIHDASHTGTVPPPAPPPRAEVAAQEGPQVHGDPVGADDPDLEREPRTSP